MGLTTPNSFMGWLAVFQPMKTFSKPNKTAATNAKIAIVPRYFVPNASSRWFNDGRVVAMALPTNALWDWRLAIFPRWHANAHGSHCRSAPCLESHFLADGDPYLWLPE